MHFNIKDTGPNESDEQNLIENLLGNLNINNELEELNIKYGFNESLNIKRNKIDFINPEIWKRARWWCNDYDFLVKDPIINRAFYKFWEILNEFNLFEDIKETDIIYHCAEAPGGFIQASNIFLQLDSSTVCSFKKQIIADVVDSDGFTQVRKNKSRYEPRVYKIFTISLNKDLPQYKSYNLPSYNKSILNKHVFVTYGKDNTGDINKVDNIFYIKDLIRRQKKDGFHLITSDLGFDEGNEFNNKEQLHCSAITNCILNAIFLQQDNGHYVLKVFDIFTETSIQLLYLLNTMYEEIYVYKPKTSRPSNSEKYIICKGFCGNDNLEYKNKVIDILVNLSNKFKSKNNVSVTKYVSFKLFKEIPQSFIEKIKEMNTVLLDSQNSFLDKAIALCESPEFMNNYDKELNFYMEKRKATFKEWETHYNLHVFI